VDVIANDDEQGIRLAVRHLLELGHRRIAHIVGSGVVGELRRRSYEAEVRAGGASPMLVTADMTEAGGRGAALELLRGQGRPTAVLAANDLSAVGVLAAADELGLRIPRDLSLVGYDNTSLARLKHLSLTSVDNASAVVGQEAAHSLLDRMKHPNRNARTRLIPPRLVVRTSTAPPATP
jgi:DNA-binding LacI/PurR family transcriptional regulator